MRIFLGLAAVLFLSGPAGAAEAPVKQDARFYYDLGAAELDVSSYPAEQQAGYKTFAEACAQCHTLARPINSAIVKEADWRRYVKRMHLKTAASSKSRFSPEQAKAIIAFLAYDSDVRKVQHKAAFDAETERLKTLFKAYQTERSKAQIEDDKRKVKAKSR